METGKIELMAASTRAIFCFWPKAHTEVCDSSILMSFMFSNIYSPGRSVPAKDDGIIASSMGEASIAIEESDCAIMFEFLSLLDLF